jgi:hypothetical protein
MASAPPARGRDPRAAARRRERVKRFFIVVAGVLAIVFIVGGIAGYVYYDRETRPNRSAPDVVVDNFLREYLVHRDDGKARLYSCKSPDITRLRAFRDSVVAQEDKFRISISFDWGALAVTAIDQSHSRVSLTLSEIAPEADGSQSRSSTKWVFLVVDQSGWRVCGAEEQT